MVGAVIVDTRHCCLLSQLRSFLNLAFINHIYHRIAFFAAFNGIDQLPNHILQHAPHFGDVSNYAISLQRFSIIQPHNDIPRPALPAARNRICSVSTLYYRSEIVRICDKPHSATFLTRM
jgi:hypothetical protein